MRRLLLTWLALLLLLAATLGATWLPLGAAKPAVAYGIAAAKATLILWVFMDMRREGAIARLGMVAAYIWLAMMITLTAADYATRGWWGS